MQAYIPHYEKPRDEGSTEPRHFQNYTNAVFRIIGDILAHREVISPRNSSIGFHVENYECVLKSKTYEPMIFSIERARNKPAAMAQNLYDFAVRIMEMWDIRTMYDFHQQESYLREVYANTYWVGGNNNEEKVYRRGTWCVRRWQEFSYTPPKNAFAVLFVSYNGNHQGAMTLALNGKNFEQLHFGRLLIQRATKEYSALQGKWKQQRDHHDRMMTLPKKEIKNHYETEQHQIADILMFNHRYEMRQRNDSMDMFISLSAQRVGVVKEILERARFVIAQGNTTTRERRIAEVSGNAYVLDMLKMVQVQTRHASVTKNFRIEDGQIWLQMRHFKEGAGSEDIAAHLTVRYKKEVEEMLKHEAKQEKDKKDSESAQKYLDRRKANEREARRKVVDAENKARDERREKRLNKKAEEERQKAERRAARQKKKDDEAAKAAAKQKAKPVAKPAPKKKKAKPAEIEFKRIPTIRMQGEIL